MLVTFLVVAYSLCSSMLLILNKVRITALLKEIKCFLGHTILYCKGKQLCDASSFQSEAPVV